MRPLLFVCSLFAVLACSNYHDASAATVDAGVSVLPDVAHDPAGTVESAVHAAQAKNWPLLVALGMAVLAFGLRRFAPLSHYLHTKQALAIVAILSGGIEGVAQAIYQHGFSWVPIAMALGQVLLTGLAMAKPMPLASDASSSAAMLAMKRPKQRGFASLRLLFVLIPIGALCGAATCGPLAKQVGIDIAACALGQVPATVSQLVPDVIQALNGSPVDVATMQSGLIARGVDVALCALEAAIARMSQPGLAALPNAQLAIDRAHVMIEEIKMRTALPSGL